MILWLKITSLRNCIHIMSEYEISNFTFKAYCRHYFFKAFCLIVKSDINFIQNEENTIISLIYLKKTV